MTDPSAFRNSDLVDVYGPYRVCFLTARLSNVQQRVDPHHILGRGGKGDRSIFSSVLNLAYLRRDFHEGPLRDAPEMRSLLLRVALTHVVNAAAQGKYTLHDIDRAFVAYVRAELPDLATLYSSLA